MDNFDQVAVDLLVWNAVDLQLDEYFYRFDYRHRSLNSNRPVLSDLAVLLVVVLNWPSFSDTLPHSVSFVGSAVFAVAVADDKATFDLVVNLVV